MRATLQVESSAYIRRIDHLKIPRPNFNYGEFEQWRKSQTANSRFAVEIGCGVGLHPIRWAQAHPEDHILAIERTKTKFSGFASRLTNHPHLKNIFPAHADAALLLPHILPRCSVDSYYILYPNPYPKARHKNLRFGHSSLTLFLADTLKPNGTLVFATNIETYAEELLKYVPSRSHLEVVFTKTLSPLDLPRTHFERKYLARGEPCYSLVFSPRGA